MTALCEPSVLPVTFWVKVVITPDCWRWTAAVNSEGYGVLRVDSVLQLAHRLSYEAHVGPIPEGLESDHLCFNTLCVNPSHLEPVTPAENRRRWLDHRYAGGLCGAGLHPLVRRPGDRQRRCRRCETARRQEKAGVDARCQLCFRPTPLTQAGLLRKHGWVGSRCQGAPCPGSGQPPLVAAVAASP